MRPKICLILSCSLLTAGCADELRGVTPIINRTGIVAEPAQQANIRPAVRNARPRREGARGQQAQSDTLSINFEDRFHEAAEAAANDDNQVDAMMQSGFLLVRSSCDEFFSNAAILQRDAQIGRDMIAPIITVLTGIIALKKFSSAQSDRYLNILNLGSNAVLAGISLVDKHFLFDSDNIADVRELTFKAIAADEKGITDNGTDSFETGMSQLIEHQAICTPAYIARLTKQAIKATEITPDTGAGNPTDQAALAKLGDVLGLLGPATPQQALALMALYQAGVPGTAVPANLVNYLKVQHLDSLVQPGNPLSNPGTITVEGTQKQQKIVEALGGFSNETHAKLVRNVPKVLLGTARSLADVTIQPGNNTRNVELIVR